MSSSNNLVLLILLIIALILVADAAKEHGAIPSEEEKKELERQLKAINKPAIKSFKTENGEIFDCIDINKQLAFDHPLLKNHSIQLKPTTVPEWITGNNISQKVGPFQLLQEDINCPDGTVIVKRNTMTDLLHAQRMKSIGFNGPRHVLSEGDDLTGHHFATADYRHSTVFGVKANLNLWDPKVSLDQVSLASMAIAGGRLEQLASISVGWMVHPLLYQAGHVHLYTYWTADGYIKTGCYDIRCPGFVQVSKRIALGALLQPVSIYAGTQLEIDLKLHQDRGTGDWWFKLGSENIGYWPNSLFIATGLGKGAHLASWGGQVYSPSAEQSPLMGSGHFPKEGFGKAAFINGINIIDGSGKALIPQIYTIKTHESSPNCYKAKYIHYDDDPWIRAVFYGGPGGCTRQVSI